MHDIPVIDIANEEAISSQAPVRQLVYLVLLLATKDRATKVQFEPSAKDSLWKLSYEVGGCRYDMEPVPLQVPISQEIRRMARIPLASVWQRLFAWRRAAGAPEETPIHLVISGKGIRIKASVQRPGSCSQARETVVFRFPETAFPAEEAKAIIDEWSRKHADDDEEKTRW